MKTGLVDQGDKAGRWESEKCICIGGEREKEQKNWQLLDNGNEVKSFISICAHML